MEPELEPCTNEKAKLLLKRNPLAYATKVKANVKDLATHFAAYLAKVRPASVIPPAVKSLAPITPPLAANLGASGTNQAKPTTTLSTVTEDQLCKYIVDLLSREPFMISGEQRQYVTYGIA